MGKFYNFKGLALSKYRSVSAAFTAFSAVVQDLTFVEKLMMAITSFNSLHFNLDAPYLLL